MPTYSVDQIVGKTLIARQAVKIKRSPTAVAPVVFTVSPGNYVGTVYSWVMDGPNLYWQYYDENQSPYYTLHQPGLFSIDSLQDQGALTVEQQTQAAAGTSVLDNVINNLGKTGTTVLWVVGGAIALSYLIPQFTTTRTRKSRKR